MSWPLWLNRSQYLPGGIDAPAPSDASNTRAPAR